MCFHRNWIMRKSVTLFRSYFLYKPVYADRSLFLKSQLHSTALLKHTTLTFDSRNYTSSTIYKFTSSLSQEDLIFWSLTKQKKKFLASSEVFLKKEPRVNHIFAHLQRVNAAIKPLNKQNESTLAAQWASQISYLGLSKPSMY